MVTIGSHRSADRAARMVLEEHRRKAFETAFRNTKLAKKNESIKDDALSLYDETKTFMEAVADAAGGSVPSLPSKDALRAILKIAGIAEEEKSDFEAVFSEELALMVVNGLTGVASLMVPYVGLVMGGKDMLAEWVKTAIAGHKSYTTKRSIPTDILPGDPQLAAQAVRKIITREASNHARLATINTVKFAVDVSVTAGAMGADVASPITGAATAGAKLANSIFLLGRDYYEMKSANALLTGGTLPDPTRLFNSHPILGAYLIVGADDSDLLFFFIDDMGAPGWMDKVEQQKKKTLGPLQKEARKAIENSRFDLAGFSGVKFKKPGVASKQSRVAQIKGFVSKLF
jgi:hypothetical protein